MKTGRPLLRRVTCVLVAGLVLADLGALAQGKSQRDRERERRREQIQARFLEDREPAWNLREMAATPCVGGFAGSYPCSNIDLLAFMPLASVGGGEANDIWGWTDPVTGKEYALLGRTSGTSFVDITDPLNPVYLGNLPPHTADSPWRDIKVYADHAYIVSEASNHGMQVFDLTQLRTVTAPPVTFAETAHYGNIGSAHNVAINEDTGFAYIIGGRFSCSGGPHFVDLSVPDAPVFAGCHTELDYTHDAQCVIYSGPDAQHQGREICINSNEDTINVIDVTDKGNPIVLSETSYANWGYIHQGWLTEDQVHYIQGDELDEQNFSHNTRSRIFDMSDLDAPVQIGTYDGPTPSIDHNLYTRDRYAFEANYRSGLRVLDLDEIDQGVLTEVGYFDIYPSSDSALFNGAWSVYPYFDSGVVIVSGIEQGLFVLQPQLPPDFNVEPSPQRMQVCDPGNTNSTIVLTERNGYTGNVSLSVTGLPAGASDSFSPDPLAVPGSSTLTIATSGTAPGAYAVTVEATDGNLVDDHDLELHVADALPGQPATVAPANGALEVTRTPIFSWTAAAQAGSDDREVATDPGFLSIGYQTTTEATSHAVLGALPAGVTHYWRVTASNGCGSGAGSAVAGFTTLVIPPILVVDDDDNDPNVAVNYTDALTALGESFDVWDTGNTDNEPSAPFLADYETVIWFTGAEFGGVAGPGPGAESALTTWLDNSGCLMIASQDYFVDRGLTGFMQSHLGVASAVSDGGHTRATGQGSVFSGLGMYNLVYPYISFPDEINADATAEQAWKDGGDSTGVNKDTGVYRTTYWGFGLETITSAIDRQDVMAAFMTWCNALPAIDGDTDGVANESDCAPGDVNLWATPSPARNLVLSSAAMDNVGWQAPATPGGNTVSYDVLRSGDPAGFDGAVCVETGGTDTLATETAAPAAGQTYYYLVRSVNGCGTALADSPPRVAGSCS